MLHPSGLSKTSAEIKLAAQLHAQLLIALVHSLLFLVEYTIKMEFLGHVGILEFYCNVSNAWLRHFVRQVFTVIQLVLNQ